MGIKEEQKQHLIDLMNRETLEEAALKWFMTANKHEIIFDLGWIKIFEAGAKWQQERMYSEEDLLSAFEAGMMFIGEDKGSFKEWFERFKNK